jgi:hypothetical protein
MEFEDMKKIWDAQNNQPLYVIDEQALHNRIKSKMNGILRIASMSELSTMIFYLVACGILITLNNLPPNANIFMYIEAAWMFGIVVYIMIGRIRRIRASRQFDRTILGDLDHAIALSVYKMRLSRIILWNLVPMGAIMIFSGWEAGKLLKASAVILVSYALAFYVGTKERRMNKRMKRELQLLKDKLEIGN